MVIYSVGASTVECKCSLLTKMQHNIPVPAACFLGQKWHRDAVQKPQVSIHSKPGAPVSAILESIHCKHLAPVWSIAALVVCEQEGVGVHAAAVEPSSEGLCRARATLCQIGRLDKYADQTKRHIQYNIMLFCSGKNTLEYAVGHEIFCYILHKWLLCAVISDH